MILKTKVDMHVFSAVEKYFLTLENIISYKDPNVSNKQGQNGVNPYTGYVFYAIICNTIKTSK